MLVNTDGTEDRLGLYLVDRSEIYAVVNGILLELATLDRDSIEVYTVQFFRLRVWAPARAQKM